MNRFIWLIRREIWEHRAIWIAPLVVLGCLALALVTGNVHLGPIGTTEGNTGFGAFPAEMQLKLLVIAYAGLALVVLVVMGIISFFYSLDSLYSDRRDRSVLFWKSLPLSDAETVLSKFAVACVVIPLVAMAGAVLAQLLIAAGGSARLAMSGMSAGILWQPQAIYGGITIAFLWCFTAMLWYAPIVGYLMLASAWAPRGPFLWAVLPPVAIWVAERMVMGAEYAGDFIAGRLFGLKRLLGTTGGAGDLSHAESGTGVSKLSQLDLVGSLKEFYSSPDLWLGVLAAGLLLAAAMWVRRYRDETS